MEKLRRVARGEAEGFIARSRRALERIGEHGARLITPGSTVLTYSSSETARAILNRAKGEGKGFRVIVPESRPMCEGRELARELGHRGIPCTLIVDGAISAFIENVHLVLVGADRVSEDYLVNKVGTRGIAIIARQFGVPIYTACETSKFLPQQVISFAEEPKDPGEICPEPLENVQVVNLYFEPVELSLFTGIITEEGIWSPEQVQGVIRKRPVVSILLKSLHEESK